MSEKPTNYYSEAITTLYTACKEHWANRLLFQIAAIAPGVVIQAAKLIAAKKALEEKVNADSI